MKFTFEICVGTLIPRLVGASEIKDHAKGEHSSVIIHNYVFVR